MLLLLMLLGCFGRIKNTFIHKEKNLIKASMEGRSDEVVNLIAQGKSVDQQDEEGRTSLLLASLHGHSEIVDILLKNKANINLADEDGVTPLIMASFKGNHEIVKLLLENEADVNLADHDGFTPLYTASRYGKKEVVEILLNYSASINNVNDENKRTPLLIASWYGYEEIVKLLLEKGAAIDLADEEGTTPLMIASENGLANVVEVLLNFKASIDLVDTEGRSALLVSSTLGHLKVVEKLLSKGAKADLNDNEGMTPLYIASQEGNEEVVKILLSKTANTDQASAYSATPLHIASQEGHKGIVEILLGYGALIDSVDKDKHTPLYVASFKGHKEVVELLLTKGAKINLPSNFGKTPLYVSVEKGHQEVIEVLLGHGALIDLADQYGITPLYLAAFQKNEEAIGILLNYAASINCIDTNRVKKVCKDITQYKDILKIFSKYISEKNLTEETVQLYKEEFGLDIMSLFSTYPEVSKMLIKFSDVFGLGPNKIDKNNKKTLLDKIGDKIQDAMCSEEDKIKLEELFNLAKECDFKKTEKVQGYEMRKQFEAKQKKKKKDLEGIEAARAKPNTKDLKEIVDERKDMEARKILEGKSEFDRNYTSLSIEQVKSILSVSSDPNQTLKIISQTAFRGSVLNKNENIMQILVWRGFEINLDLFLQTIKNNQLKLMGSILTKMTSEQIEKIKIDLPEAIQSQKIQITEEMSKILDKFLEKPIKKDSEMLEIKEDENVIEKCDVRYESPNLDKYQDRIFVYNSEVKADLQECLKIKKLSRNLTKYLNKEKNNAINLKGLKNGFELRGHGKNDSNKRIYFTVIGENIVVLLAQYKKQPEILKNIRNLLIIREKEVI